MPSYGNRQQLRLKDFDYSQLGVYFVTVYVQHRRCLFGDMLDGQMVLGDAGQMIGYCWYQLENKFPSIHLDQFTRMPNHIHGLRIVEDDLQVVPALGEPGVSKGKPTGSPLQNADLIRIVQWFRTRTTNAYIQGVRQSGWPAFSKHLWQCSFYDHIGREESLVRYPPIHSLQPAPLGNRRGESHP